jgi:hypothetical protein
MSVAEKMELPMKSTQETRLALVEQSISHINHSIDRFEKVALQGFDNTERRFNTLTKHIDEKADKIEKNLDKVDHYISKIDQRMWTNFYWLLATMFTLAGAGAGILAKGFKWLT